MSLFGKGKRKLEFEEFARENEMIFLPKDEYGLGNYFKGFKLFSRGGAKGISPIILNTRDSTENLQYGAFDYQYIISTGNTVIVMIQTVFFWLDKSAVLPAFFMFPEKWYHKWAARFGMQDIDFAIYPEFSDQFVLQSSDPDYTRHIFQNDELIHELKGIPKWTLECEGYYTILYVSAKQQKVVDMADIFERGHTINALLRS